MAKTPGFTEYVDDRNASITAQLRNNDPRTKSEWFEVQCVDSNGVLTRIYSANRTIKASSSSWQSMTANLTRGWQVCSNDR